MSFTKQFFERTAGRPAANLGYAMMQRQIHALQRTGMSMLHTARPFSFYRKTFYRGANEKRIFADLAGKRVLDVGCGHTPYLEDSMFQKCRRAGIDFHAADPLLGEEIKFGLRERALARAFGSRANFDLNAPGLQNATASFAQNLPFDDDSMDEILCSYLIFVWIEDESTLNEVFSEFHRILKPSGIAKVYPYQEWHRANFIQPDFSKTLAQFSISQTFIHGGLDLRVPPSMLTEFVKSAN